MSKSERFQPHLKSLREFIRRNPAVAGILVFASLVLAVELSKGTAEKIEGDNFPSQPSITRQSPVEQVPEIENLPRAPSIIERVERYLKSYIKEKNLLGPLISTEIYPLGGLARFYVSHPEGIGAWDFPELAVGKKTGLLRPGEMIPGLHYHSLVTLNPKNELTFWAFTVRPGKDENSPEVRFFPLGRPGKWSVRAETEGVSISGDKLTEFFPPIRPKIQPPVGHY